MGSTPTGDPFGPYVPRLAADWLADEPARTHRRVRGTAVFADISGFTSLTERLAARGKGGAEEMGDLLNATFEQLLTAAYDYGANLVKWGGDAVLLLFDSENHHLLACRAAWEMQQVMRRIGRVETSRGVVRLGMSIGLHTGDLDFLLVGTRHRELIVTGPAASTTAHMEKIAQRGQVVVSHAAAAMLPPGCVGAAVGDDGVLLAHAPEVDTKPNRRSKRTDVDLGQLFCEPVREYLRSAVDEHEHRTIAVGFVEFAGTDTLLDEDGAAALEQAVTELIDAAQQAAHDNGIAILSTDLAENGGKIIFTAGAPVATGNDENRVLAAVRRVVRLDGRLRLRGGVTCGAVFAGDYGPFYRRTYSIAGDVVNLAARLMAKADSGQVLATPQVIERSRTPFETTPLEPFAVKGKKQPVQAVLVGEQRRVVEAPRVGRLPLVGRDAEMTTLLRVLEETATVAGIVVEVVAPPGMGKSRLLEELVDRADMRTIWFDGDVYSKSVPYQPMHRALRQTLQLPLDVSDEAVIATLTDLVTAAAPDLLPWLPLIGIVAGVQIPFTPEVEILDAAVRRARLEAVTSDLLGRLLTTPTLLVVNDVHFMDEATVSMMSRLAEDVASRRWLIVVARRPGTAEDLELGPQRHRIELQALDTNATGELLLTALGGAPLPPHRMRRLVERAGGHPLFLTMLATSASHRDDSDDLPDTVEALIAAEIDKLSGPARRLLRTASVLGMSFDPHLLQAVLADDDLAGRNWDSVSGFLHRHADQQVHFAHHLIRLTAYEGLPYRRRTALHARAAHILEAALGHRREQAAALLSMHCLRGEQYEQAWHYARIAGRGARDQFALAEAAECLRRALDAAAHLPELDRTEHAEAWESLVDLCYSLGESDELDRALRSARACAQRDPVRYARLCRKTADHRLNNGRHRNALTWVARGRRALGEDEGDPARIERAALLSAGARLRHELGEHRSALVWAERAVDEAASTDNLAVIAETRGIRTALRGLSGQPWDEQEIIETLTLADQAGDLYRRAWVANAVGMSAYFAGRWDDARAYYQDAEDTSRRIGQEFAAAVRAANRAEVLVQQRRAQEAIDILRPALLVLVGAKAVSYISFAMALLARAEMMTGALDAALDRLSEARRLALDAGEIDEALGIEANIVQCLVLMGEPSPALGYADTARSRCSAITGEATSELALMRARAMALVALGRSADAVATLQDALRMAQDRFATYDLYECLTMLLDLHADDAGLQVQAWDATRSELAEQLGIVLDEAVTATS